MASTSIDSPWVFLPVVDGIETIMSTVWETHKRLLANSDIITDLSIGELKLSEGAKRMRGKLSELKCIVYAGDKPEDDRRTGYCKYSSIGVEILKFSFTLCLIPPLDVLRTSWGRHGIPLVKSCDEPWSYDCTLAGSEPRPWLTYGIDRSAFTDADRRKLLHYRWAGVGKWSEVTQSLYFPFLTCEVSDNGFNYIDCRNMHSGSVAIKGVLQLVQEADRHRTNKILPTLNGEVLAYSISQCQEYVSVYGHHAVCEGDKWIYYRHFVSSFDLRKRDDEDGALGIYNLARNVLDFFGEIHFRRLQECIEALPEPEPV